MSHNHDVGRKALEIVGLSDYADRQISQLSGGQFQRVLIARCLVQDADYILLDEPFVGIDSVSEEIIMNKLRDLKKAVESYSKENGKYLGLVGCSKWKYDDVFDYNPFEELI